MTTSATGHRPPKLGGYSPIASERLYRFAIRTLARFESDSVISGMALGWDTAVARAALYLGIPLTAAIPFIGQEEAWPAASQAAYNSILNAAARVEVITAGGYTARAMQLRNEWMVDNCNRLLELWDGSAGGTGNCVAYADKVAGCEQVGLWEAWQAYLGETAK